MTTVPPAECASQRTVTGNTAPDTCGVNVPKLPSLIDPAGAVKSTSNGASETVTATVPTAAPPFPSETVYVSVRTEGTVPSAVLKARWTFQGGQVVQESSQTIAPKGTTVTEFHVSNPKGWPKGSYQVEVFLNGSSVETESFKVG